MRLEVKYIRIKSLLAYQSLLVQICHPKFAPFIKIFRWYRTRRALRKSSFQQTEEYYPHALYFGNMRSPL